MRELLIKINLTVMLSSACLGGILAIFGIDALWLLGVGMVAMGITVMTFALRLIWMEW